MWASEVFVYGVFVSGVKYLCRRCLDLWYKWLCVGIFEM